MEPAQEPLVEYAGIPIMESRYLPASLRCPACGGKGSLPVPRGRQTCLDCHGFGQRTLLGIVMSPAGMMEKIILGAPTL